MEGAPYLLGIHGVHSERWELSQPCDWLLTKDWRPMCDWTPSVPSAAPHIQMALKGLRDGGVPQIWWRVHFTIAALGVTPRILCQNGPNMTITSRTTSIAASIDPSPWIPIHPFGVKIGDFSWLPAAPGTPNSHIRLSDYWGVHKHGCQ